MSADEWDEQIGQRHLQHFEHDLADDLERRCILQTTNT